MFKSIAAWMTTVIIAGLFLLVSGTELMARRAVDVAPEKSEGTAVSETNAIPVKKICGMIATEQRQAHEDAESCLIEHGCEVHDRCLADTCEPCADILRKEKDLFSEACLTCENTPSLRYYLLSCDPNGPQNAGEYFTGVCEGMKVKKKMIKTDRETRESVIERMSGH
jgi:hypothetical protein